MKNCVGKLGGKLCGKIVWKIFMENWVNKLDEKIMWNYVGELDGKIR